MARPPRLQARMYSPARVPATSCLTSYELRRTAPKPTPFSLLRGLPRRWRQAREGERLGMRGNREASTNQPFFVRMTKAGCQTECRPAEPGQTTAILGSRQGQAEPAGGSSSARLRGSHHGWNHVHPGRVRHTRSRRRRRPRQELEIVSTRRRVTPRTTRGTMQPRLGPLPPRRCSIVASGGKRGRCGLSPPH